MNDETPNAQLPRPKRSIERQLRGALRDLAEADADLGASPGVAIRLHAAVRRRRAARERRHRAAWLAAAATIVIAVTGARWYLAAVPPSEPSAASVQQPLPDVEFLPLPYANVPAVHGQIVQIVVPASAMASFGLDPSSAGSDAVQADVFVGEDGLARGIRFNPFTVKEFVP